MDQDHATPMSKVSLGATPQTKMNQSRTKLTDQGKENMSSIQSTKWKMRAINKKETQFIEDSDFTTWILMKVPFWRYQ